MILLRAQLRRWYHFRSPRLSQLNSADHLKSVMEARIASQLKNINRSKLEPVNLTDSIKSTLNLQERLASDISVRSIAVSVIGAASLQHSLHETRLDRDIRQDSALQAAQLPFPDPNRSLHHFSEYRGHPNIAELNEYNFQGQTLLVFNLPNEVTVQEILVTLKVPTATAKLHYDLLGLPAYAQVNFGSPQELKNCLDSIPKRRINFGERVARVRSQEDQEKMKLGYRRVVVQIPENTSVEETVLELGKFGRVMHVDWPLEASIVPAVEQVKEHYKDSSELIRISEIHSDGTVESQYYPEKRAWSEDDDERDLDDVLEGHDKVESAYEHRSRYARNIDIMVGQEGQVSLKNRGYFVVTYSTYEQAQAFYMKHGASFKMSLVGERLDFEWDPLFRKEVLRQVDNEYLHGKKKDLDAQKKHDEKYKDPTKYSPEDHELEDEVPSDQNYEDDESQNRDHYVTREEELDYNLEERIMRKVIYDEAREKDPKRDSYVYKQFKNANKLREWEMHRHGLRKQKEILGKKSFDELAEVELYGRVLPKDEKIERIIAEDTKHREKIENILIEKNDLLVDKNDIRYKNQGYQRLQERFNRRANAELGVNQPEEEAKEGEGAEGGSEGSEGGQSGRYSFSTGKTVAQAYRERTAEEQAHFLHRYHEYLRSLISEYQGVFHDKLVEEAAHSQVDFTNPHNLQWADGGSFLTPEDVVEALQFRRNFREAQEDYETYVYSREMFRSSGVNLAHLISNYQSIEKQAKQHFKEVGVVQEVKQVSGKDLEQKVKILNSQVAEVDEEFELRKSGDENYLVKVVKYLSLNSNKKNEYILKVWQDIKSSATEKENEVLDKHFDHMIETGEVPMQVKQAFHLKKVNNYDQFLAKITPEPHLTRKDMQVMRNMKELSDKQVRRDEEEQLEMERAKVDRERLGSNSFAKDPSEIYVKDREGYYKVSRYRQI